MRRPGLTMDDMLRQVPAIWFVALLALACTACGEPAPVADRAEDGGQGDGPWLGYWESVERSRGGLGSALYVTPRGHALTWTGVLVDGTYRVEGDQLLLGEDAMPVPFAVEGDRMTQGGEGSPQIDMKRVGAGEGIEGVWRYPHPAGEEAFQRYEAGGTFRFRMILGAIVVRRYERLGDQEVALAAGKRLERAVLHLEQDRLVTEDGNAYTRIGDEPWYPLP